MGSEQAAVTDRKGRVGEAAEGGDRRKYHLYPSRPADRRLLSALRDVGEPLPRHTGLCRQTRRRRVLWQQV